MAHRQIVFKEALVSEAEVNFRLDDSWIQREYFLEFFHGVRELVLLQGLLTCAKGLFDLIFGCLASSGSAGDEEKQRGHCESRHFPSVAEMEKGRQECRPYELKRAYVRT